MAIARKPAKAAGSPAPKSNDGAPASPGVMPTSPVFNQNDLADEDKSLAAMPVQIFDAATAQIADFGEVARDMSLRGAEGLRSAYDRNRLAAEEALNSIEQAFAKSGDAVRKLQIKAIDVCQAQTLAMFELTRGVAASATISEALAFSSEHCRKEIEASADRAREFAEYARGLTEEALAPLGSTLTNAFGVRA